MPKYAELDALMAERFGVKRTPVPVIVQNAAGTAGVGEAVGRLIIGRGFRITLVAERRARSIRTRRRSWRWAKSTCGTPAA